jgi:hypothetical protein
VLQPFPAAYLDIRGGRLVCSSSGEGTGYCMTAIMSRRKVRDALLTDPCRSQLQLNNLFFASYLLPSLLLLLIRIRDGRTSGQSCSRPLAPLYLTSWAGAYAVLPLCFLPPSGRQTCTRDSSVTVYVVGNPPPRRSIPPLVVNS